MRKPIRPKGQPVNTSERRRERRKRAYAAPTYLDSKGNNRHPISGKNLSMNEQQTMRKTHQI